MSEFGKVQLPKHLVEGLGLNRDICDVTIHTHSEGELRHTNLKCDATKTIHGCRSDYQLGNITIYGCPLRSDEEHSSDLLEKNLEIVLPQQ